MKKGIVGLFIVCVASVVYARNWVVPTQQPSSYPDTVTSTNIVFNYARNDVKKFTVRLEFLSTASNCVQIAFGRDLDQDGDLSYCETDFVLGSRNNKYFVEWCEEQCRHFEDISEQNTDLHFLELLVEADRSYQPKSAALRCDAGLCFAELTESHLKDFFKREWNLMKVTRAGAEDINEACKITCDYSSCYIIVK